jgi:predicted acetyltransferase
MQPEMELTQAITWNIEINPATVIERPILQQLMELYLYDFSEFDGADLSPLGVYEYPYIDHYWVEPDRSPFLVRVDGQLAGFVLVARYNYYTGLKDAWVIAEFFILRKYRHKGVGEHVARYIFDRFTGNWQVAQIAENQIATTFWRKVITRYSLGFFQEQILDNDRWRGPVQTFTSPPPQIAVGEFG